MEMRSLICCLFLMVAATVPGAEIRIDFSGSPAGTAPTNFHVALAGSGRPPAWQIVMDTVPPLLAPLTDQAPAITRRAVLAQTSQDTTDEHFPLCLYEREIFKDFKLTARFKLVSGMTEQMAGVVFRYQNTSNFYVLRASALGHNIRFYKMVDGLRSDPIGPALEIPTNVWHTLAVQCQGNQITCWLNDQPVMPPLQDNTFTSGQIGFWTKSDAVSYFCDPIIEYTPRIPAAQRLVNGILEKQPRILELRIYALNSQGVPRVIASKVEKENGQPGTDSEKEAITSGKTFYGKDHGTVVVTLPFRDRNGDIVAAVRVRLKSFFGETQNNALTRAILLLKTMQAEVIDADDLLR